MVYLKFSFAPKMPKISEARHCNQKDVTFAGTPYLVCNYKYDNHTNYLLKTIKTKMLQ